MTEREKFEQAYAQENQCTLEWIVSQRMRNGSYEHRYLARAWYWYQRGWAAA
jgi:hypothetical protein